MALPLISLCPHRSHVRSYITTGALLVAKFNEQRNRVSFYRENVVRSVLVAHSACSVETGCTDANELIAGNEYNTQPKKGRSTVAKETAGIHRK